MADPNDSEGWEEAISMVEMKTPDNLVHLPHLDEDAILQALRERYSTDKIYTNCGDILIAVNPYKNLDLYGTEDHERYNSSNFEAEIPPHVFNVAASAYRRLREKQVNQVVIVSGESGAGKTESTKYMVKHIVHMCKKGSSDLNEKIIKVNPLLEAFGNAKTIMNRNSSRYAKYLELSFDGSWSLSGAVVRDYMLEKSRVVTRSDGEGNFHIFYALFAGASKDKRTTLNLDQPTQFYRIMKSDDECLGETQFNKYKEMYKEQMEVLDRTKIDKEVVHVLLAAVIHLTQIAFVESETQSEAMAIEDAEPYAYAADLLSVDTEQLGHALIANQITVRGEKIVTFKSKEQAEDGRDALAKMVYERMFGWLVRQINLDLHPSRNFAEIAGSIAILDIAGFEKLRENSFEQLCINIVNEKLQNFANDYVFVQEMQIYKQEGIGLEGIKFVNNDATLEMFQKSRTGMLALLDEQTKFAQGTDESFVHELNRYYKDNPLFVEAQHDRPEFGITHFAGMVWYNAKNFLEKNRDRLGDLLEDLMKTSGDPFIKDLFTVKKGPTGTISATAYNYGKSRRATPNYHPPPGKLGEQVYDLAKSLKKRFGEVKQNGGITQVSNKQQHLTVVSYFQSSLMDLLNKMKFADPAFVRCLRPNNQIQADLFLDRMVEDQLKYNGIAEIAKIRRQGFSIRRDFSDFLKRYQIMLIGIPKASSPQEATKQLLLCIPADYHQHFRCGKHKVFMKEHVQLWLEKYLHIRKTKAARTVCNVIREVAAKKREERRRLEEEKRKRAEEERLRRTQEELLRRTQEEQAREHTSIKEPWTPAPEEPLGSSQRSQTSPNDSPASSSGSSGSESTGTSDRSDPYDDADGTNRVRFAGGLGETAPKHPHWQEPAPPSPPQHRARPGANTDQEEQQKKKADKPFWDIFQIIAREQKGRDVHEFTSLKVIKVCTYIFLFLVVLFCAVCQKLSLAIMLNDHTIHKQTSLNQTQRDPVEELLSEKSRYVGLIITICCPYALIFITSLMKWIFGNLTRPKLSTFISSLVVESLHTTGLCLLVFKVLCRMDMVRGILLLSSVSFMPAVLKIVCASDPKRKKSESPSFLERLRGCMGTTAILVLDVLAVITQIAAVPVIILWDYSYEEAGVEHDWQRIVQSAFCLVLVSFSWWENFVDDRLCGQLGQKNIWSKFILGVKFDLQESRSIITTFTSLWKLGLTVLLAWTFRESDFFEEGTDDYFQDLHNIKYTLICLILAGYVGHYFAYTACKLRLQFFSFTVPLLLSTPTAAMIAAFDCFENKDDSYLNFMLEKDGERLKCDEDWSNGDLWWHGVMGALWLASLYWICRHIWMPRQERLAKIERLFVNPYYCSILFEEHMLLNRRRHNRKIYRRFHEGDKVSYRLSHFDTRMTDNGEMENKDTDDAYNYGKQRAAPPKIYACATMWHENRIEMVQLLKSLFRMDRDQFIRRQSETLSGKIDDEFYEFEAHILFDDAMEVNDDDERVPNGFVRLLVSLMEEAASSVYEKHMAVRPPVKVPTPYGGQLIWEMPGNNFMFCHLKDKSKIRHRKRWSQVMYMYYLLGFRIIRMCQETVIEALNNDKLNELVSWDARRAMASGMAGKSLIFQALDEEVIRQASNTFILALDGDVDFTPGAVRLLLDRMKKSDQVGAACGRIHPIGSGPLVWYQKFEYAIAHWLQKSTEHVLGCVLCSPGCFSLFRGSALMDDNMMRKYTILPTEAAHHLMYDQGEDRWLCTLLLQQGYRVDYAAASDAFTYAPEGFGEFFNQRRRWMPSTVVNIVDLLKDWKNTVSINPNISLLYIVYQVCLLLATVIGPATVLMMIAGANLVVFKVNLINSYIIALAPAVFYFIICLVVKQKWQLIIAEILSAVYAFIMMIVFVGSIVTAVQESPLHPSVVFVALIVFMFTFAAIIHPREWTCAIYGTLYFLCVPSGYLLLVFYSLCNMHVVSWGTREVPKKKTKAELEEERKKALEKKEKKKLGFFGRFWRSSQLQELKDVLSKITEVQKQPQATAQTDTNTELLKEINKNIALLAQGKTAQGPLSPRHVRLQMEEEEETEDQPESPRLKSILHKSDKGKSKRVSIKDTVEIQAAETGDVDEEDIYDKFKPKVVRDDMKNPAWADDKSLGNGETLEMYQEEATFWRSFIDKYLYPLPPNKEEQKKTQKALIELRNSAALGMAMINLLWIAINFMFQLEKPTTIWISFQHREDDTEEGVQDVEYMQVDILGLLFIIFFFIVLGIQFVGMLIHRWGTFLHLVSITELTNPFEGIDVEDPEQGESQLDTKSARKVCEQLLADPLPDYPSDEEEEEEEQNRKAAEEIKAQLQNIARTGSRFGIGNTAGGIGASSRMLGRSTRRNELNRQSNRWDALKTSMAVIAASTRKETPYDEAPESDEIRNEMQEAYIREIDPNVTGVAPPTNLKQRFGNFAPFQQDLMSQIKKRNPRMLPQTPRSGAANGNLIPESQDEDIYEEIKIPGTLGRQMGRRLNLLQRRVRFQDPSSSSRSTQRPMSTAL